MISLLEIESAMATDQEIEFVENAIYLIRGQRVMLDSDLARIYRTSTTRLNEQRQRNRKRFPSDFAFQLTREEFTTLISQSAISSSHGGRRKLPWVFTEHGAIMLASVLNSDVAVDASVRGGRACVRLRELVAANTELARKFAELERRLDSHDAQIAQLFAAIRQLLAPAPAKKREIGFHAKDRGGRYRVRNRI